MTDPKEFNFRDINYNKYCTERELEILEMVRETGSRGETAKRLDVSRSRVRSVLKRVEEKAIRSGYIPDDGMVMPFDQSLVHTKSTVHVKNGEVVQYWARLSPDQERYEAVRKQALIDFVAELPKIEPVEYEQTPFSDLMACYPVGDPHVGVLCWGEETGQDWDLKIATEAYSAVYRRLIESAPPCEQAVIFNLGDFFHADNMRGMTERSGHVLDMDGRYAKMKRVGYKIMRMMIEYALERHERVRVINSIGNHDDTGAIDLSIALNEIYENEPRLTVDIAPTPYHYVTFGKVLIGAHHGHTTKMANLPMVMATDQSEAWGKAVHRYWYTGHIHHDSMKETPGCKTESFRTLAAKDSYATWHGFRSRQDSKAIVMHKEFGEVERHTVNLEMVAK